MKRLLFARLVISSLTVLTNCSKKDTAPLAGTPGAGARFQYADSIFYLSKDQRSYAVYPVGNRPKGSYSAHPDNLDLDPATGKIISRGEDKDNNSLTGLWYKIKFTPEGGGLSDSTYVLISG